MMMNEYKDVDFQERWKDLMSHTDGWPWYWLGYGEKCYCFATVSAFPLDENAQAPQAGTRLEQHETKENVWVGINGVEMLIDDHIAGSEQQCGDVICWFIAAAWAEAQARTGVVDKW